MLHLSRRGLWSGVAALSAYGALTRDATAQALGGLASSPMRPGWVLPGAVVDYDFQNGRYFNNGTTLDNVALTSAAQDIKSVIGQDGSDIQVYLPNQSGVFTSIVANALGILPGMGLPVWGNQQLVCLNNRDLTQIGTWTAIGATAARANGADNGTNTGSKLTLISATATVSQVITLTSQAVLLSACVKQVSGGPTTVQMSVDNGTTQTTLAALTSSFQQLPIPQQTLANPTVLITLTGTIGDVVAFDFIDLEIKNSLNNCVTAPGPPLTVGASLVTRSATIPYITNNNGGLGSSLFGGSTVVDAINCGQCAMFFKFSTNSPPGDGAVTGLTDGASPGGLCVAGSAAQFGGGVATTSNTVNATTNALSPVWNYSCGGYYGAPTTATGGTPVRGVLNGGSVATGSGNVGSLNATHMVLGSNGSSQKSINGLIARFAVFRVLPPDGFLVAATTPPS